MAFNSCSFGIPVIITKSCDFKVLLRVERNKCGLAKRPWGHLTAVLIVVAKLSVPINSLTRS